MDRRPLSPESLKTVIQYMGPNSRYHIRQSCPTIRQTEKLFPLTIEELELDPHNMSITMNETSYKLGVITYYHNVDETPDNVRQKNNTGGVLYDVDRYGFRDDAAEMTPGDLKIPGDFDEKGRFDYEAVRERDDYQLTQWEGRLTRLNQDRVEQETLPKTQEVLSILERLDKQIKEIREKMLPYQLRRDNGPPRVTNYLQLTVQGSSPKIEYVNYQKLGVAMKYLTSKMLGGQREPILVNHLKVKSSGCAGLPQNLKVVVRQLSIPSNVRKTLNAIQSIFDQKSFPLEAIFLSASTHDFKHQIIKTAQKLVVTRYSGYYTVKDLAFSNLRVDFRSKTNVASDSLIFLVKKWRERGREIGTHYSFAVDKKEEVQKTLDIIEKETGAKFGELEEIRLSPFPKCVTFPINEHSEINIYGEEMEKNELLQWILHVNVQPSREITPLYEEEPSAKKSKPSTSST